ncbi:MAG: hypothetical protein J6A59_01800 [Lachnospiraceae bacterium]|nr:hypothetical protein [Lachnospiraceae bacterium]
MHRKGKEMKEINTINDATEQNMKLEGSLTCEVQELDEIIALMKLHTKISGIMAGSTFVCLFCMSIRLIILTHKISEIINILQYLQ